MLDVMGEGTMTIAPRLDVHDLAQHWRSVGMAAGAGLLVALAVTTQAAPLATGHGLTDLRSEIGVVRGTDAGVEATGAWLAPIGSVTLLARLARQLERDPLR
jgi:hypothetical protein